MKILIVCARYYPEPFSITRIAEGLVKKGNSVTVLTGRPNYGKWKIYDGYENIFNENINGVNIIRVKEKARKKGFISGVNNYLSSYFLFASGLKKIQGDFDIVLSHVMSPIFTISKVPGFCKKRNIPQMLYGFDLWPESLVATGYFSRKSFAVKILKSYCKKIYNSCDLITFASPSAENYFKNYLKINKPFRHIYQPCLSKIPSYDAIKEHTYKKNGVLSILFCGNMARFNRNDLFLKALSICKNKNRIVFHMVGSGFEYDNLQKLVTDLRLDNVKFYGRIPVEKTREYYYNADVLFVPLYCNSATSLMIPQKVIEYFMYGRPIFGMLKGDGADLIEKASSLNIVSDQTIESLANNLDKIFEMKEDELMKCGAQNRLFFDENSRFKIETICDEINESLHDTITKYKDLHKNEQ